MRGARAPQGGQRGGVRGGRRYGVLGKLRTKGSKRGAAVLSERAASNLVGQGAGGDQRQVNNEEIGTGGVAEGAEEPLPAASRCGFHGAPESVRVVKRKVSRELSASLFFCDA